MQTPEIHTSREIAQAIVDRAFARVFPQPVQTVDSDGNQECCDLCGEVATVEDFDQFGFRLPMCAACATDNPSEDVVSFALRVLP